LAQLRTELELAVRRPRPAGELVAAIESARVEVERLQRLAEDLLLLAQAGEGRLQAVPEVLEVGAVLAETRDRFLAVVEGAGRSVVVEPAGGVVRADPRLVRQALTNLVDNALQHGAGSVRLSSRREGDRLALVVADEGPGFESELLDRATGRFVHSARSTGAGLGLAIVAAVADAHDGMAGVANLPCGAQAWISLPVAPTVEAVGTTPTQRRPEHHQLIQDS
jgi:signal transduction histidine kinase